jgi:hypothetical protein
MTDHMTSIMTGNMAGIMKDTLPCTDSSKVNKAMENS